MPSKGAVDEFCDVMWSSQGSTEQTSRAWKWVLHTRIYPARAVTGRQCPHRGMGEDFFVRWRFFLRRRPLLETKNRYQGAKWTVSLRATNKPLTKFGVQWQKTDFLAENQVFGPKKGNIVLHLLSIKILGSFWDGMWSFGMDPKLRPSQALTSFDSFN